MSLSAFARMDNRVQKHHPVPDSVEQFLDKQLKITFKYKLCVYLFLMSELCEVKFNIFQGLSF